MSTPKILYEDNHIIVAQKPQNVPSQADASGDPDFLGALKEYVRVKYGKPGQAFLGLVHRLDRPAGGVMVFARTSKAAARLAKEMQAGGFKKRYLAVSECGASIPKSGAPRHYLIKDCATNTSKVAPPDHTGAKFASLEYAVLKQAENLSLFDISLDTGRHHQIRVQLQAIGAPLYGDFKYGGKPFDKLCLWAYRLDFTHPTKRERMEFYCAPPDEYPWTLFGDEIIRLCANV